jgi:hypothetical protein
MIGHVDVEDVAAAVPFGVLNAPIVVVLQHAGRHGMLNDVDAPRGR